MTPSEAGADRYAKRRDALREAAAKQGLAGLLVSHAANRYYLSGFELHDPQCNESAGSLLVTAEGPDHLLTDPRYLDAARRLWPEERIVIYTGQAKERMRSFLAEAARGKGVFGVEAKALSVDAFHSLTETMALTPTTGLVEDLRLYKDDLELSALERSCAVNHAVLARVPELLAPGRTEKEIAWDIEKLFRELGADELAFASIVAVGPNAALPHAIPGLDKVEEGKPVLIDIGGRAFDYCSDQTRTFWVGKESGRAYERFKTTLDRVREAQDAAIACLQPGLPLAEAYSAARKSFMAHGVEARFTHSLGHGIGLETHEAPSLGPAAAGELLPGMVVTVEPGLYDASWGGARWEYMVAMTENGPKVF